MPDHLPGDIGEFTRRLGADAKRFAGKTVLVAGGHGFLGRYVAHSFADLNAGPLAGEPCKVVVVDSLIAAGRDDGVRYGDAQYMWRDVTKPLRFKDQVNFIFHMAGIASPVHYRRYPLDTLEVSFLGTQNLLDLARSNDAERVLFFSSSEVYGDPAVVPTPETYWGNVSTLGARAPYDEGKRVGETLCRIYYEAYGVPVVMVRPFNCFGPGFSRTDFRAVPNFFSHALRGQPMPVHGDGRTTRTFCYATDSVVGFFQALLRGRTGAAYNIGADGPEVTMLELARRVNGALGRAVPNEFVGFPEAYPKDQPQRRCPDLSKARAELGYEAVVGLDEGLARFASWAREAWA